MGSAIAAVTPFAGARFKLVEPAPSLVENARGNPQNLAPRGGRRTIEERQAVSSQACREDSGCRPEPPGRSSWTVFCPHGTPGIPHSMSGIGASSPWIA